MKLRLLMEGESLPGSAFLYQIAAACGRAEKLSVPCHVRLSIEDGAGLREINREFRGIDRETDVLSFPAVRYPPGKTASDSASLLMREWDPEESSCFLGDVVISLAQAERQAAEYGQSLVREAAYLLAHGIFHLLGYDHQTGEEKGTMRAREKSALAYAGTENEVSDGTLLEMAAGAMRHSYAPYSGFKVGACLLTADGRLFTGCNVENASYGLTNCAERTAVFKAVSEGATAFSAIAIAATQTAPWPCGACRQVLSEFCSDLRVLVTWGDGAVAESSLAELLPMSFSPSGGVRHILGKER